MNDSVSFKTNRSSPNNKRREEALLSVIVPAFNEEKILFENLSILHEYLESLGHKYRWEMIIIDDGSTDATGVIADQFAQNREHVTILHHPINFRLGQVLRYAFSRCRGDYIVVMDVDLSYSPDHIEKMLIRMQQTNAKIVIASPYMKGGKVSNVPMLRRLLSSWANRFLSLTIPKDGYSDKLTTITGMVRAYDGEFLRRLSLKAMDVDINHEIIYKATLLRARIVEIPAHLNWKLESQIKTSAGSRRSSLRIMSSIFQSLLSGFMFRPFLFFILPGSMILLLSLYPLFWTVVHTIREYTKLVQSGESLDYRLSDAIGSAFSISPHSFIVGGVALLVGIQLISLGLISLQNKRYFENLYFLSTTIYYDPRRTRKNKNFCS